MRDALSDFTGTVRRAVETGRPAVSDLLTGAVLRTPVVAVMVPVVRGGAMGTAELCAWGVPSILIPWPSSSPATPISATSA